MSDGPRDRFNYVPSEIPDDDLAGYDEGGYGAQSLALEGTLAVLVVDMTNEFVDPQYPNGSETGESCARGISTLLETTREHSIPTVYTRNPGFRTDAEKGQWASTLEDYPDLPRVAYEITPELEPREDDAVLEKAKPSAFFETRMESVLNYYDVDTVVVTGMTTSGCVRATVIDAFSYNYDVVVPEDCVADRATVPHRVNLFDIGMKYATITDVEGIRTELAERGPD